VTFPRRPRASISFRVACLRAGEGENLEKGGEEGGNPGQGGEGDAAAAPGEEEGRPTRDANKPKGLPRFIAANPPNALERKLQVCCIRCRLIKTKAQFYEVGCENCPSLIPKGSQEEVEEYTSKKFDGIISVVDPDDSWARKWVRLNKQIVPGVYAMRCREFLRQ